MVDFGLCEGNTDLSMDDRRKCKKYTLGKGSYIIKQARVAQLVASRLAVPEIRVQTPPGAN